ncbi:MAG TPA: Gfo/Idh/MocA family oxidoreductase, partial [Puia sp.]|nr:Gfo/Idh/MocA family oxidoreductase [Puia sp.]
EEDIDLVYIATPPFLHYEQSKMALLADKHVICEKPAALKMEHAAELQSLAEMHLKLYVVNLMQRYNPLYEVVKNIIEGKLLGNFLHGFFENYASDENLKEDHWFWDESKSGGIFIEHGVHFFDMFSGWLGEGKLVSSLQLRRPSISKVIFDRVQAIVNYEAGPVSFYHGFDQPNMLDRQEMRLQFERGEVSLYGWIPVKCKIYGLLREDEVKAITSMLNNFSVIFETERKGSTKSVKGRFKDVVYEEELTLEFGSLDEKLTRYKEILKRMLEDQWKWIKDRNRGRAITGRNGVDSLKIAQEAARNAIKY